MLRFFVNIVLIVVFFFTVLPIKQVGGLLFGNQLNEELAESSEQPTSKKNTEPFLIYFVTHQKSEQTAGSAISSSRYKEYASHLPTHPVGDILVPPPNYHFIFV